MVTVPNYNTEGKYAEAEIQIHVFVMLELGEGEWPASRPGRFTPRERASDPHWIGGWLGPRAALDSVEKRKISCSCRERYTNSSAVQPVAIPIEPKTYEIGSNQNYLHKIYKNLNQFSS
jgi:hypothetical protein